MGVTGWSEVDQCRMRDALDQARQGMALGEVPVGAVVCQSGKPIAKAHNRTLQDNDPTAHAEVVALRAAAQAIRNHRLEGTELYVTLEPCAMCLGALLHARVRRLVFAAYDERAGAAGSVLDLSAHPQLNHRVEVNGGLLRAEASELLANFFAERR